MAAADTATLDYWLLAIEAQPRWCAALRVQLSRTGRTEQRSRVVCQADLPQTSHLLAADRPLTACLEVTPGNLAQRLEELTRLRISRMICLVGLIDGERFAPADGPRVAAMLSEAGATHTATSPAGAGRILRIADRHAAHAWHALAESLSAPQLISRRLPWQSAPWAVG